MEVMMKNPGIILSVVVTVLYPAWIRISSSSGKIQSDKAKDLRGFAIKIMGVKGERFQTQDEEKETQDFILLSYPVKGSPLYQGGINSNPSPAIPYHGTGRAG